MILGWKWGIAAILAFALVLPNAAFAKGQTQVSDQEAQEVEQLISTYHVSGIDDSKLRGKKVDEMLNQLGDPYTALFAPTEWQQFENSLENQYVGIGIRVGTDASGFYVDEVFAGSPAEKAGLAPKDVIKAVDGTSVSGLKLDELVAKVTGKEGTTVMLTIDRGGQELQVEVTRAQINLPVVTSHWFADGSVGYISIAEFSSQADEAFTKQLKALKDKGLKSLIIDLRYNPGGRLDTAQGIAEQLIKEGVLIHTRDHNNVDHPVLIQDGTDIGVPVFVLANQYSASASEVLTGALQDYGVAKLVGTRTFGKGSVQQLFSLSDGGVLKLTVEEYFTPKHRKVNKVGLLPQVYVEDDAAQLVTALRLAGEQDLDVKFDDRGLTVNGESFGTGVLYQRDQGDVYVSSRLLAAAAGENVSWDGKRNAVVIGNSESQAVFPVKGKVVRMVDGASMISLKAFTGSFPQLTWTDASGTVQIHAGKGE